MVLKVKRVYEPAERSDGLRVLIDRLWPRGLTKEKARVDLWLKELAPSDELRRWYAHDPAKYPRFRARFRAQLLAHRRELAMLAHRAERETVTLVYAARDAQKCNASVLAELLREAL